MKYFLLILVLIGLYFTFRTEESRKSFFAKFTTQKKVITENREKAYLVIPPLLSNGTITKFKLATNMVDVNASWWKSLPKEEKDRFSLLMAVYIACENKVNRLELKVFSGDTQLGTYAGYEGYTDYNAVDFDKFNK